MADTVTTTIINNGPRNIVVAFTNVSDGTGEAGVLKLNATSTGPYGVLVQGQTFYPGIHLKIREIDYDVKGMLLRMQWVATTPVDIFPLGGFGRLKFQQFAGLIVPPGVAGITGSIQFTTQGQMPNSSYSIVLRCTKNVPVS